MRRALVAVLALGVTTQCTKLPSEPVDMLVVEIKTTGTGPGPDSDDLTVTIDGEWTEPIGTDRPFSFPGITPGAHTVELGGLPPNCTVVGDNPEVITVVPGATVEVVFTVVCTVAGALLVETSTTGSATDSDGFIATVDGDEASSQAVGPNGSVVFNGLEVGEHLVELGGLAANCSVEENPRKVVVTEGGVARATFEVTCVGTGSLLVRATTTGSDLDPDGYTVTVDADPGRTRPLGPNGSAAFLGLSADEHIVALGGVATNCSVAENPRLVTVAEGGVVEASFEIDCSAAGSLLVRSTTTGTELDPDGYTVTVDADPTLMRTIGQNGSAAFSGLSAGEHVVALGGVAPNCTVADNPRLITVAEGGVAEASFMISCEGTGWLLVHAATTGSGVDADGYTVTVDADDSLAQPLGPNGSAAFPGLTVGEHLVTLGGVAPNCVVPDNPRLVAVAEGGVVEATFSVGCEGTGWLIVQATTTGSGVDADGYTVTVDGDRASAQVVGPNSSISFGGLSAGTHTVALGDVAANCTVVDPNPQSVTVAADATVQTRFAVACEGAGSLVVQATTTGSAVDVDGYTVTVDGDDSSARGVGSNGSVLFAGLTAGEHSVLLSGIAVNCSVVGTNPRSAEVAEDATVQVAFAVTCDGAGPAGSLEVVARTTGTPTDPDGYLVTLDGDAAGKQSVEPNGSVLFEGLVAGEHTVQLDGIAAECSVVGPNPRMVTVETDAVTSVTVEVTCGGTGWLLVSSTTSGADPDVDGYTVTVDSDAQSSQRVAANGSVAFEGLAAGEHLVELTGVAPNCDVVGPNPRLATVEADGVVEETFAVLCVATTQLGTLEVDVTTTGYHLDPDGYTVVVDGTVARSVPSTGSVSFEDLAAGWHTLLLTGIAPNCGVTAQNPTTVWIEAGQTVRAAIVVECAG